MGPCGEGHGDVRGPGRRGAQVTQAPTQCGWWRHLAQQHAVADEKFVCLRYNGKSCPLARFS